LQSILGASLDSPADSGHGFVLSVANLTLLYRHALLARLLNLRIADLFQLLSFVGLPQPCIETIDQLMAVLEFFDWFLASGYKLDDLGIITNGPVQVPAAYPQPATLAAALAKAVAAAHALEFADHVFMTLPGLTEAESQQMIVGNPAFFELVPGAAPTAYRLTPAYLPGTAVQFTDTVFGFLPGISATQSQQIVAANPTLFTAGPALQLSAPSVRRRPSPFPPESPLIPTWPTPPWRSMPPTLQRHPPSC
jgi:hypothetical protein